MPISAIHTAAAPLNAQYVLERGTDLFRMSMILFAAGRGEALKSL